MKKTMGLGYRAPFHSQLINGHAEISWVEIITENYLWDEGVRRQNLEKLRDNYELAFHGVSLSLAAPIEHDRDYLLRLKQFCQDFEPVRVSDHLCWSSTGNHFWHDLLPFPYSQENLQRLTQKVLAWQEMLGRPLVLENLSAYLTSNASEMSEYEFLAELCKRTDCQVLLDLNNMTVNAHNFGWDPRLELRKLNLQSVAQVHLAGHVVGEHFAIDTHSEKPNEATWQLWRELCSLRADIPYMIEWDADIPSFEVVMEELKKAEAIKRGTL
jgi:hypothetical protein